MRRPLILLIAASALALPGVLLGKSDGGSPTFAVSGFGWGHGVGMSQCGAYGFAKKGRGYREILAHYYRGTEIGTVSGPRIRVLLASGRSSVEIASDAPFRVQDRSGTRELPAGRHRLGEGLRLTAGDTDVQLAGTVTFLPGKSPLVLDRPYRGRLVVSLASGGLQVVNDLGIEKYIRGVIAGEMPADWHPEALKVQAVAARTYALASRRPAQEFDVFADTRSQVYGGVNAEEKTTNAAASATKGQVVEYKGKIAWTFFSASSGGRTAAIADVWDDAEPQPYLVSVDDPFDDVCPYHRWGPIDFTVSELRSALGDKIPAGLQSLTVKRNDSGRVDVVVAKGAGRTTQISGSEMRSALGLRSTWFRIERR
jgi:stage II sporulation protein D